MHREYVAWDSPTLGRKMELLWFGHAGRPMIWYPTSVGRFYQNEDFGLVGTVADLIEGGQIQVCCVDSVDEESFYAKTRHPAERIRRHDQYDRYVYSEVVPFVRDKGRTGSKVATLGASFGAYHAVNFGLRHPDVCDKVVGLSGKYDIHSFLDGYCLRAQHERRVGRQAFADGPRHRDRRDRQHPLWHHRHAPDPGRQGPPGARPGLGRALRPRLALVEGADSAVLAVGRFRGAILVPAGPFAYVERGRPP
jgi:S-formylglutathione hydrolase FrmB